MGSVSGIGNRLRVGPAICLACIAVIQFAELSRAADETQKGPSVTQKAFGKTPDGVETKLFTCSNAKGATTQVTDYGARLVSVEVPDRNGKPANVTLGFDSAEKYG